MMSDNPFEMLPIINLNPIERWKLEDPDNGELQYTGEAPVYVKITSANGDVRKMKLSDGDKVEIVE